MSALLAIQDDPPADSALGTLAQGATHLSADIVEVAGLLETIDAAARAQLEHLAALGGQTDSVIDANRSVQEAAADVERTCHAGQDILAQSLGALRDVLKRSQDVARWVASLDASLSGLMEVLREVESQNSAIAGISRQINILAVNAKIEAARAGEAGKGFAVVAEAINELSQKTALSAGDITQAISALTESVEGVQKEAATVSADAHGILTDGGRADAAMSEIAEQVDQSAEAATRITTQATRAQDSLAAFKPQFQGISTAAEDTALGIEGVQDRMASMIDTSEGLIQGCVEGGGSTTDSHFIDEVQRRARKIGALFEEAISQGKISTEALFTRTYSAIAGTNPQQHMAPFTDLTDRLLPGVQEGVLEMDSRVVFCAAVDTNGYLPTHNRVFSKPQGKDPTWNAGNCRNRRIFDDRVGLKAGRNTRPFLLQVYRRDMGGGTFVMMKDVSAPIMVQGRHWGGLRLAYRME